MMFAQDEAIALQRVGRVGQFKRLACSGILRRGHLVLATAQALGGPSLAHERKGLRHDERKILAEKRVHLARSRNRRILADADQADAPARVMPPPLDPPAADTPPFPITGGTEVAPAPRHPARPAPQPHYTGRTPIRAQT